MPKIGASAPFFLIENGEKNKILHLFCRPPGQAKLERMFVIYRGDFLHNCAYGTKSEIQIRFDTTIWCAYNTLSAGESC